MRKISAITLFMPILGVRLSSLKTIVVVAAPPPLLPTATNPLLSLLTSLPDKRSQFKGMSGMKTAIGIIRLTSKRRTSRPSYALYFKK